MKKALLIALLLLAPARAAPPAEALVKAALKALSGPPMTGELVVEIERPGSPRRFRLRFYTDGEGRSRVRVLEPPARRGEAYLFLENGIWLYDPRFDRVVELPPSSGHQRFLGSDLSALELSGQGLLEDYQSQLAFEDERRYVVLLTPRPQAPTPYGKLELVIEKARKVPLSISYYDQRGIEVKRVRFSDFARLDTGYLVTAGVAEDLVHEGWRTRFRIERFRVLQTIDPGCFTPEALPEDCP